MFSSLNVYRWWYHYDLHRGYFFLCCWPFTCLYWLGLGFVTSITFIFLVGVFMSSWLGASVLSLGEWFIKRMPFVRHIYNASKQISAAISPGVFYICFLFLILTEISKGGNFNEFSSPYIFRSKHTGLQGSCHHKASTYWWICIWFHNFICCSPGLYQIYAVELSIQNCFNWFTCGCMLF